MSQPPSGAQPQWSADGQWWWNGQSWVPASQAPRQTPPKKSHVGRNLAIGCVVLVLALGACVAIAGGGALSSLSNKHTVEYSASTSDGSTMLVTYGLGSDESQINGAKSPWSTTRTSNSPVIAVLVVQQNGSGTVTCSLKIDGKVVK